MEPLAKKTTMTEAELDAMLAAMTPAQAQEAIREIESLKKKHEESMLDNYVPQEHQVPIHADKRKIVTVMGGNRCIGGEQEIWDPVEKVSRRVDGITEDFHVLAWDGTKRVIAKAHRPFSKPKAVLYAVEFGDGTKVVMSGGHHFLGSEGWISLHDYVHDLDRDICSIPEATIEGVNDCLCPDCLAARINTYTDIVNIRELRKDIVWDFTVEKYHNYFVSEESTIVQSNSGKSHCCGFTVACHAMGKYPEWWVGVRFNSPLDIGVISITQEQLRKSAQVKLMGEPYALGTGFIPKEAIHDYAWRKGSNGCLDWVLIRHASGGLTRINFMTCEMGQRVFMGFSWDLVWFDEEPELDVFNEVQMRLVDKKGYSILSFYPYKGESELIQKLDRMPEEFCGHYQLAMSDNTTLDPEEIRMHELTMPEWEKESRMYGRPGAGEGRIFQFSRDEYVIDPFDVEESWGVICGLDVGFGHATAAVAIAYDPMADCAYVFREYVNKLSLPNVHASALRKWGDVDFRIDTSSHRMAPTDGKSLWDMYREEGLNIYDAETRSGSLMSSINKINVLLSEKRLYIFSNCRELVREMGLYRTSRNTKTGEVKVVKKDQDCVDAFRYAVMWLESNRVPGVTKLKPMPKVIQWEPFDKRIGI